MTRFELYNADEAFFSGTAAEIAPIVEVDQRMVGRGEPGKWTMKISAAFRKVVTSKNSKYQKWLTPVY
jgi:branched-chain amino acid aminotransferase